jgi:hypothetical protein
VPSPVASPPFRPFPPAALSPHRRRPRQQGVTCVTVVRTPSMLFWFCYSIPLSTAPPCAGLFLLARPPRGLRSACWARHGIPGERAGGLTTFPGADDRADPESNTGSRRPESDRCTKAGGGREDTRVPSPASRRPARRGLAGLGRVRLGCAPRGSSRQSEGRCSYDCGASFVSADLCRSPCPDRFLDSRSSAAWCCTNEFRQSGIGGSAWLKRI